VSGDCPDQLQAIQERGKGLLNNRELTSRDVFELAFKGGKELDEVLSLCVKLLEGRILYLKELHAPAVGTGLLVLSFLNKLQRDSGYFTKRRNSRLP
jgi:hypothetical protein